MGDARKGGQRLQDNRDRNITYVSIYFPTSGRYATVDLSRVHLNPLRAWWLDLRAGIGKFIGSVEEGQKRSFFRVASSRLGLVFDDKAADYPPPHLSRGVK